ncbi:MAG: RDD family protein [Saprospiraceae bacterium]|nr:RDD family protein [Saprospiraceae bacterium]
MRTIDITTTQNVVIQYELATVIDRALAFLLDLIVVGLVSLLGLYLLNVLFGALEGIVTRLYALFPICLLLLYHFFSEVLIDGQSLGKRAIGIKVVRLDGEEPSLSDYLLRAVFHIADSLFSLGIIAILLISTSNRRQRLGDMTANTTVIKTRSIQQFHLGDIIRIGNAENYQPVYPDVRALSEQDMLLVKQVLGRYQSFPNEAHKQALDSLTIKLATSLQLPQAPRNQVEFLKTLLRDYIVLTR